MALNLNIPQPTQTLAETQQPIQDNFTFINNQFAQNHIEFNSGVDSGKHKVIQLPQQAGPFTTGATEVALFAQAVSGATQLVYQRVNNGTPYSITDSTNATSGWTCLASPIILWWHRANIGGGATALVNFAVAGANFPGFAAVYNVQATVRNTSGGGQNSIVRVILTTNLQVEVAVQNPSANNQIDIFVIGLRA